jgi:hypothetical protein
MACRGVKFLGKNGYIYIDFSMGQDWTIPAYLTAKSNIVRHILFTALFALVFINIYAPFGVETWFRFTQLQLFFYSSLLILIGILVVVLSRILMYKHCKRKNLHMLSYLGWVAAEILTMAFVYTILLKYVVDDPRDLGTMFKKTVQVTALVLLLPYAMLWLYFALHEKNKLLARITNREDQSELGSRMIPFHDEKGDLKFSVKLEDLVYLEAADNYVNIYYADLEKLSRFMIRNTLKKILQSGALRELVRCHRSYAVNTRRIKLIRKEKDGLHLDMDHPEKISIPVSGTYAEAVLRRFSSNLP